jgi:Domain of unknown function (DUF5666)
MRFHQKSTYVILAGIAGIAAIIAIFGIAGCAVSPSGDNPSTPAGVPGFARGVITAKGSVFVNGIEYDTNAASVTLDNLAGADDDLAIGMNVSIKGHIDTSTGRGTADEIDYACSIDGTIDIGSIDLVAGTFDVFGQTILTDLTTVYDGSSGLSGTNPLASGDRVEISGVLAGTSILANRVELKNGSSEDYTLRGTIGSLSGSTFNLTLEGGAVFAVAFTGTLDAGIANGSTVKIETGSAPTGLSLTVTAGKIEAAHELEGANGDRVEVEGIVSEYAAGPPVTFTVDGIAVSATSGLAAGVANGLEVHAEGTLSEGVLIASSIEISEAVDLELKGVVSEAPNLSAETFRLNGVTVYTGPETIFVDDSDAPVALFGLDDLSAGDTVEVKGFVDDASRLTAAKIERHTGDTEAELQGIVSAKSGSTVTVYGLVIDTTPLFGTTGERDAFLNDVTQGVTRVKIVGTLSGNTVTWATIELDS